jgi:hypothetical protein
MTDITREILNLGNRKSNGPSKVPTIILKKCCGNFSKIFYILFNAILKYESIPLDIKISSIAPVHKPNKPKDEIQSYRPVSISNNFMKVFESLIYNKFNAFITKNFIIPNSQYGFKSGVSTSHQLIDLLYDIIIAFDDINLICIDALFLDNSDAFVTISHLKLLQELYSIGIRDKFFNIIVDFLKDRKQFVKFDDCVSQLMKITLGVIQGGKLSPVLFNIYIRKLINFIDYSKSKQYADYNVVYKLIYNESDTTLLQNDLNFIEK